MANDNIFDLTNSSSSMDSTSTGGKVWYTSVLLFKTLLLNIFSASDSLSSVVIEHGNFGGSHLDDGMFSKSLRLADGTDFKDIASLDVIEKNKANFNDWLRRQRFSLIGSVKFSDLSEAQLARIDLTVAGLRSNERYSDHSKFSTAMLVELSFNVLRKAFEDEAAQLNKLEKEDEVALKAEYKRLALEARNRLHAEVEARKTQI